MAKLKTSMISGHLQNASWLQRPSLARVFEALNRGDGETRIIGGAVRNALLGEPVNDVDLATVLEPQEVMRRAASANLAIYPTGRDHGTVTVVADGDSYEITTLRRDVATDGRRAVVAFTSDWHEDALRRDFTINALSATQDGNVLDTVGGLADLAERRVRFIGDAEARIREDYLRILRFFRFTSAYAKDAPDARGLAASIALKDGMRQLSAERIGSEMMKFIVTPRAGEIAEVMQQAGVLQVLTACAATPENLQNLQRIEVELGEAPDVATRLATLLLDRPGDVSTLAQDFRLSKAIASDLTTAAAINPAHHSSAPDEAVKAEIYRSGSIAFQRALRVAWARSGASEHDTGWLDKSRLAASWRPPAMPISGADVMALNLHAGPTIGHILRDFEGWWISAGFPSETAMHKAKLAELVSRRLTNH